MLPRWIAPPIGKRPVFPRAGGSGPSPPMASTRSGAPSPAGFPNLSRASPTASLSGAPPVRGPSHPPPHAARVHCNYPGIDRTWLACEKSTYPGSFAGWHASWLLRNFAITEFSEVGWDRVCCLPTAAPPCGRFGSALGCAEGRLRPPLARAVCAQGIPRPPPSSRSLPATRPSGRHSQTLLLPGPPTPAALREARTPGLSPCSVPRLASGILLLLKGFSLFRSEAGGGSYCRRHHLGAPEVTLLHLGSGYLAS